MTARLDIRRPRPSARWIGVCLALGCLMLPGVAGADEDTATDDVADKHRAVDTLVVALEAHSGPWSQTQYDYGGKTAGGRPIGDSQHHESQEAAFARAAGQVCVLEVEISVSYGDPPQPAATLRLDLDLAQLTAQHVRRSSAGSTSFHFDDGIDHGGGDGFSLDYTGVTDLVEIAAPPGQPFDGEHTVLGKSPEPAQRSGVTLGAPTHDDAVALETALHEAISACRPPTAQP